MICDIIELLLYLEKIHLYLRAPVTNRECGQLKAEAILAPGRLSDRYFSIGKWLISNN